MILSFCFWGFAMDYEGLPKYRARAAELDARVRADYPRHAGEARSLMNRILRRTDRQKWLVFNGEACDRKMDLGSLHTTHRYVSSLLECRDKGQPVTGQYLESAVRACLGLGFAAIRGGRAD
ncbi:MAG: hypothetical protein H6577_10020 [Lewinellaceae bacterium]|nr:hypothetical protein [Saprospiraceae bacterium]MCB9338453.1 hypothetical protein [Lewinellaceae bacterium]